MANCATDLFSFDVREHDRFPHVLVVDDPLEPKEDPNTSCSDSEERQRDDTETADCTTLKVRAPLTCCSLWEIKKLK
jgi:hypothetical protein